MTNSSEDALKLDAEPSEHIIRPRVIPIPRDTVKYIFGSSQTFQSFDESRPESKGLTVPLRVREYYFQGQSCLEQEDWEMAVLFFSRALHLDSTLVDFYALRAEAYIQLCDFSSAAQNLRRAYTFKPENTKYQERLTLVLYLQGQCLFEQCSYEDALHVFSQASELQPQKPCFRYRCMACLLALKRHQDCLTLVTKELKQVTTNADVYILRARLYNFFHKPSLCYQDLHNTLLLEPKHPQAKALLRMMVNQAHQAHQDAGILAVQGNMQLALQRINCAIENNPLDPSFFLFRGTVYRRLREFDGAVEDFLKALDMVPEDQEDLVRQVQRQLLLAYNDFAVHCYIHGAYQESLLLLNKALKDEQGEKGLYINRGDCFFQLGNLAFAEADYQQALALSPHDQGANLRMGMLHEKMGCCEQKRRQFHKAEDHFTMAIQHSPQKARYYLQRAKSRQLLQNFFGARQDVATVLLLEPEQRQLLPLMTSLFPGMSVNDVLSSQVACLAKFQLKQAVEKSLQFSIPKDIMGLLKERELERQRARALQHTWKLEQPSSEELKATSQALQEGPGEETEVPEKGKEEEPKQPPEKGSSLSSGYFDQTSSDSILGFRGTSISETGMSTTCQEYRSTSTTPLTFSSSSMLKIHSSDSGANGKKTRLTESHSKGWSLGKTQDSQGSRQRPSKTEDTQGSGWRVSKTKNPQSSGRRSSKAEDAHGSGRRSSKTKDTHSSGQRTSKTEDSQGPGWQAGKTEDTQTKDTQGPRRRLRKVRAAHGRRWGPSKFPTHGQTWGLSRSCSKTKDFCDLSQGPCKTDITQGRRQRPNQNSTIQYQNWELSPCSSKDEVVQGQTQRPSKAKDAQHWNHRLNKAESLQGWSQEPSLRPSKMKAAHGPSQSLSKTEAMQGSSQSLQKAESAQNWSPEPSQSPTQGLSPSPSNTKVDWSSSPTRNTAP
ncbi:PREDICTED: tetratricopeptide repeat protein 16 [Chrysochloris asiatica]|uniref:Tetratricopeptide repeat protein 16 n=1 Tax=Chrysochloris asiatica TaxID=185453 RepID=A0A9B0WGK7_CHRAS|nr:PREDICTED: tetratricopeptide repeat protein 16 [Chrysochloris asiatica]